MWLWIWNLIDGGKLYLTIENENYCTIMQKKLVKVTL